MADPFSIFVGAVAIIQVTSGFVKYLRATTASAAHVSDELNRVLQESATILAIAESIQDGYNRGTLQSPIAEDEADLASLKDLKRRTDSILENCKETVEKLDILVRDVIGKSRAQVDLVESKGEHRANLMRPVRDSKFAKKFQSFRVQLRKDRKDGEFNSLLARLERSKSALQLSVKAIHRWNDKAFQSTTARSLDDIIDEVQLLAIEFKSQNTNPPKDPKADGSFVNEFFEASSASNFFTGRKKLLDTIHVAFTTSTPDYADPVSEKSCQKRVIIYGLGGSGKTEFCLKFCENYQSWYWGVFWVDASSHQKAENDFKRIATHGKVAETMNAAKSWLSSQRLPWLLVIDNADDALTHINDYFPGGKGGNILITTRDQEVTKHGTVAGGCFHFVGLEEHDAESLLLRTAKESNPWPQSSVTYAASITKALGYLPLALVHAGNAIANGVTTLEGYVDYFEYTWRKLREKWKLSGYKTVENNPEKNVFASYDMLFQDLDENPDQSSRDAIEMLKLFAFLDCNNIRLDFLNHAARNPWQREEKALEQHNEKFLKTLARPAPLPTKKWPQRLKLWAFELLSRHHDLGLLPDILRDVELSGSFQPTRLREALRELARTSLLTHRRMKGLDIYSMHPLVHKWIRERPYMRLRERGLWCQAAVTILTQCIALPPLGNKEYEREMRRQLLPHLDSVRERQAEYEKELKNKQKSRMVSWMLVTTPSMDRKRTLQYAKFSRVYMECARFQDAADLQSQVKDYLQSMLGADDPKTWDITLALSMTLWLLTHFNEALKLQKAALESCSKTLGEDHFRTLKWKDIVGKSQSARGRFKEALKLHEEAIEGLRTYLPSDDKDAATKGHPAYADYYRALTNLAYVNQRYFRYKKAEGIYTTAVEGLAKTLGDTDDDTLWAKEGLAMASLEVGGDSLDRAYNTMIEVVDQRTEKAGPENGFTLWSTLLLARVKTALGGVGWHLEAEEDMSRAIRIGTDQYGANHLAVLAARTQLANNLIQQERYSDADTILKEVMDPAIYKTGAREEGDHPDRLVAVWYAVTCCERQGKLEQAMTMCDEIADTLQSFGGGQHPFAEKAREKKKELGETLRAEPLTAEERNVKGKEKSFEEGSIMEGILEEIGIDAESIGESSSGQKEIKKKGIAKRSTY